MPTIDPNQAAWDDRPLLLVQEAVPADEDVSGVYTGLAGVGTLLFRLELRKTSALAAAPDVTVTVEHSADGDSWDTLGAFDELTAEADAYLRVDNPLDQIRFSYAVTTAGRIVKLEAKIVLPVSVPDAGDAGDGDTLTADGTGGFAWVTP